VTKTWKKSLEPSAVPNSHSQGFISQTFEISICSRSSITGEVQKLTAKTTTNTLTKTKMTTDNGEVWISRSGWDMEGDEATTTWQWWWRVAGRGRGDGGRGCRKLG